MKTCRFGLNEECFLVKGAKRGAIYDLKSEDVYSIDEIATKILEKCEQKLSLREIATDTSELTIEEISEYLTKLQSSKLGRFLKKGEIIEKTSLEPITSKLGFLWLEITQKCNLRCVHCYNESGPQHKRNKEESLLSLVDWIRIIGEAYQLDCRKVQFIGGEPLLKRENLFQLITLCKKLGYKVIEVFTNATLITKEDINVFSRYGVQIAVSLYSKNPAVHDDITRKNGSWSRSLETLKRLKRAKIPTRIAITVTQINQEDLSDTIDFFKEEIGITDIKYDLIRPIGRGCKKSLFPNRLIKEEREQKEATFPKTKKEDFFLRRSAHNCFSKFLCITNSGKVIPCIMARNLELGDLFQRTLREIIEASYTKSIRGLSKNRIEVCRDCEYRYACFDCRPMAESYGTNLYAKPNWCHYDPYNGVWIN